MMDDLTGFQRDLLYVAAGLDGEEPPHGLAIKNEIEQHYSKGINHGRLYPNLDTLVEMGLLTKGTIDKRTNSYAITDRGYRELQTRRDWEDNYVDMGGAAD